jgi:hypothetical protein
MTTKGSSQSVTSDTTKLNTQLVCLPKSIMDSVIADLKSGDIAKQEVCILNEQIKLRTAHEQNLERIIEGNKKAIAHCNNIVAESSDLADQYKVRLDKSNKKLKRNKGWLKVLVVVSITSLFLNVASFN